jgi:hypothetical protein
MKPIINNFGINVVTPFGVIPAKAEIRCFQIFLDACRRRGCPCAGRGMTEFQTFEGLSLLHNLNSHLRTPHAGGRN